MLSTREVPEDAFDRARPSELRPGLSRNWDTANVMSERVATDANAHPVWYALHVHGFIRAVLFRVACAEDHGHADRLGTSEAKAVYDSIYPVCDKEIVCAA